MPFDEELRQVARALRSHAVPAGEDREILDELAADVDAARADGRPASVVLGEDPTATGSELAAARGYTGPPPRVVSVALTTLVPAVFIGLVVYVLVGGGDSFGLSQTGLYTAPDGPGEEPVNLLERVFGEEGIVAFYGMSALAVVVLDIGLAAGVLALRGDPLARPTARRLAVGLPLGLIGAALVMMAIAAISGYSTAAGVVVLEGLAGAAVLAAAAAAARLQALRAAG